METKYYDGTKLLSLMDINKKKPEIYICDGNRTAGKTTYFNRLLVNRFLKNGCKPCLVYRYKYELNDVADKFFNDIKKLFFKKHDMDCKMMADGVYSQLYLDNKPFGYAIAINDANNIKKMSHVFNDTDSMLFDEFQPLDGKYIKDEVNKLVSIHTSIARGNGKQVRYVPLYMASNSCHVLNPYYNRLDVGYRIQYNTKFIRGAGWVYEHTINKSASDAQKASAFNRALSDDKTLTHEADSTYLDNNKTFVTKMSGQNRYIATILYNNNNYSIRQYGNYMYCDTNYDITYPCKIAVYYNDMDIDYTHKTHHYLLINGLQRYFNAGCFRFKNLDCKHVIFNLLS